MKKKALAGDLGEELLEGEDKCTPEDEILEKDDNGLGGMEIFVSERDNRDDGDQWMVARHKNNKRNKMTPTKAMRKSVTSMLPGLTMEEKASHLVAVKNMEIPGKINAVKPNLDFAILNSIPPEYFDEIALDCKIVFYPALGSTV
jgi:hypothetical protein